MQVNTINQTRNQKSQSFQANFHGTTKAKSLLKDGTFDAYEKVVEKATEDIDGTIVLLKSGENKLKMMFFTPEGKSLKRANTKNINLLEFERNVTNPDGIKSQVLSYMSNLFEENGLKTYDKNPFLRKLIEHFNSQKELID